MLGRAHAQVENTALWRAREAGHGTESVTAEHDSLTDELALTLALFF